MGTFSTAAHWRERRLRQSCTSESKCGGRRGEGYQHEIAARVYPVSDALRLGVCVVWSVEDAAISVELASVSAQIL